METLEKGARRWRFGVFEVDAPNLELRRNGVAVKIREQPFRILVHLLENAGQLVSREDLRRVLWPADTFVDFEHSLNTAMKKLREALGDSPEEPLYIETIPKRGYRFIAAVRESAAPPEDAEKRVATPGLLSTDSARLHRRPTLRWVVPVCGIALLALAAVFLIRGMKIGAHGDAGSPFSAGTSKAILAIPGDVNDVELSPDGRQLAFVWSSEAKPPSNVYVQLIGQDQRLQLTNYTNGYVCCIDWSPDGSQIAYGRCEDDGAGVFVVPALGGSERKITDVMCVFGAAGFPRWADGGRTLILADRCAPGAPRGIIAFSLETGKRRCLASPPAGGDEIGDGFQVLSPDQRTLAFIRTSTLELSEVYAVDLSGDHLRQVIHDQNSVYGPLMWAPDGKHILFRSSRPGTSNQWQVPVDGGPIESASSFPGLGSLSHDGRLLAYYSEVSAPVNTWQLKLRSPGGKVLSNRQITTASLFQDSPQLAPDATQLVTRTFRGGHLGLWKSDIDGTSYVLLLEPKESFVGSPHWSPDARWIAMDGRIGHHSQIYLMDSEGRNFHALTSGDYENEVPRWSRDGRTIYFSSNRTGEWQLWRRDLATGHETQITEHGGISAFESFDGSTLYYAKFETGGLWRRAVAGGPEERISNDLHLGYWGAFSVTEAGIYLLDSYAVPRPSILYYDFKTRKTRPVLTVDHLPAPFIPSMTASQDGLLLFYSQSGESETEISLAESAR